jgi:DNA-binding MarR family transcriptional regulator
LLNWVILKHFTMNKYESSTSRRHGIDISCGDDGRLFDKRLREMIATAPASQTDAIEALSALRAAGRAMKNQMEDWADSQGLSEGRLHLLMKLYKCPQHQLALGELADSLEVSPRNVTGLVDHLERDGLVERVPDPEDRRSIFARLTPTGAQRMGGLWREAFTRQARLFEGFSPEDLANLRHLCLSLVERLTMNHPVTQETSP